LVEISNMTRKTLILFSAFMLVGELVGFAQQHGVTGQGAQIGTIGNLPLAFELNRGQAQQNVRFLARAADLTILLESGRTQLVLPPKAPSNGQAGQPQPRVVTMELLQANKQASTQGMDLLPGKSNYFIGKQSANWITGIPQYGKVAFNSIYPGIGVVYYGNQGRMEYDFVLNVGADPNVIRIGITGAEKLELDALGSLVLQIDDDRIEIEKPLIYQEQENTRLPISGSYILLSNNEIGLKLGDYDRHRALVIDPVLSYSTLIGANNGTTAQAVAVDTAGSVYITGTTFATNYPTVNAFQSSNAGYTDLFITKLNAAGDQILYSTYLGGSSYDNAAAIAVDEAGSAYVTGTTNSGDFPTTPGAFMTTCPGICNTPFVAKVLSDGTLAFSTYMGGSNSPATGIAVDSAGEAYISGVTASDDLPTTPGSFDPVYQGLICTSCNNGYIEKLNASGSALVYSTYFGIPGLGGAPSTDGRAIAVDKRGSAYLVGDTTAIPVQNAIQSSLVGGPNAFITKFSPDGSSLVFSTYLGGTSPFFFDAVGDFATGVAVDSFENVHVTGTSSSCEFPLTLSALSTQCVTMGYDQKIFATTLNSAGNDILFSTFLRSGSAPGIAVDGDGNSYVTGTTTASDFPVLNSVENTSQRSSSIGFVTELDPTGKLLFSTYLGATHGSQAAGIAVDGKGGIYVAGAGQGDFPLVHPITSQILQSTYYTLFVAKISSHDTPEISLSPRVSPILALRNVSSVPVTINSLTHSRNFTQGGTCGARLAPGSGCTLIEEGADDNKSQGSVIVTANGVPQKFVISKSPTGDNVGSAITIFPFSLQFAPQLISTTSAIQEIVIQNLGLQPGAINSIGIIPPAAFTQTNNCPALLNPARICTIKVNYIAATIQDEAQLAIVHDPNQTRDTVFLSGVGSASAISTSTQSVDFGSQFVGAPPLGRMVNLTNTTPYPATVTSVSTTTGFLQNNSCTKALAPHASCRVQVSFQPKTNQNAFGTLTANNYGPGGAQLVSLTATGLINAFVTVSPIALDFPQALVNETNGPQTVTLQNVSSNTIAITQVKIALPFSETDNCIGNLPAGATCTVSVSFTPTHLSSAAGRMTVDFSGKGSPQVVGLTGTVVTILRFTPSPVVFGQQQVGTTSPQTYLSIGNESNQTITLNSFTIHGTEFSIAQNSCPAQLQPYYGCALQLVFTPNSTGLRTGKIAISASDYSKLHVVQLQGTGVGSGQLTLSVTSLDFGPQKVGTISRPQHVKLTNTGSGVVNFSSITSSPGFFPTTNNCGPSLAPGNSCSVSVKFAPTLQGILSGTLIINDDSIGNPHTASLTGIGQ
jgi:hypothetical protein